jgi:hypothetical protein
MTIDMRSILPALSDLGVGREVVGSTGYPTAEEIITDPPTHKKEIIEAVRVWKKVMWKEAKNSTDPSRRLYALTMLIEKIANLYGKPVAVGYVPNRASACYFPAERTIILNKNLSIITSLHELAHHLFGTSETKACRWSVHLFRKVFPKAYERLEWRGHMLVKREQNVLSEST